MTKKGYIVTRMITSDLPQKYFEGWSAGTDMKAVPIQSVEQRLGQSLILLSLLVLALLPLALVASFVWVIWVILWLCGALTGVALSLWAVYSIYLKRPFRNWLLFRRESSKPKSRISELTVEERKRGYLRPIEKRPKKFKMSLRLDDED